MALKSGKSSETTSSRWVNCKSRPVGWLSDSDVDMSMRAKIDRRAVSLGK